MDAVYYLPLGGAGEIGMNMYLYGYGPEGDRRWIMVDCGIGFPDAAHAPGVETMSADPAFIAERSDRLEAIFITHAHEDHIGAIGKLWGKLGAPVFCGPFAAQIARRKFEEAGHSPKTIKERDVNVPENYGPFEVTFFPMTHSIPETRALIIKTPVGTIFHTADFKIDETPIYSTPFDRDALRKIGDEGVLALVCDSTNVFEPGYAGPEISVQPGLREVIAGATGKVAATTFASNLARLKSLADSAKANDREIVVAGRAMQRMIEAGVRSGIITDFPSVITDDEASNLPDEHIFYLITGSQGEGRAGMARVANGSHPFVRLGEGDTAIFSSKTIPGNEPDVARIYNQLAERGVEVIDDSMADIHVSGHACREELKEMYTLLRPRLAVPMHGERRHLEEHAASALEWGAQKSLAVGNGQLAAITAQGVEIVDEVDTGRIYEDGSITVGAMDGIVRARKKMALNGHIAVSVVVDENGRLIVESDVRATGTPDESPKWEGSFEELIAEAVDEAIESMSRKDKRDDDKLETLVMQTARRTASRLWGKKPETVVFITRLEEE